MCLFSYGEKKVIFCHAELVSASIRFLLDPEINSGWQGRWKIRKNLTITKFSVFSVVSFWHYLSGYQKIRGKNVRGKFLPKSVHFFLWREGSSFLSCWTLPWIKFRVSDFSISAFSVMLNPGLAPGQACFSIYSFFIRPWNKFRVTGQVKN